MYYAKADYSFVRFQKSKNPKKKYDAILKNKLTKREVRVPFGAKRIDGVPYPQYKDRTGLALYHKYDHSDLKRKSNYRARHSVYLKPGYYSPANFSWDFLW